MERRFSFPNGIHYQGTTYIGPKAIWLPAKSSQKVAEKTFSQRLRYRLAAGGDLDDNFIADALYVSTKEWRRHYGQGSTRIPFVYIGRLHPELQGRHFRTIRDFLRAADRETDYSMICTRLYRGWSLAQAIEVPAVERAGRKGAVYLLTNTATSQQYVGVTRMSVSTRWTTHRCAAKQGRTQTLCQSIRQFGPGAFTVETIEAGVCVEQLGERERHWIAKLNTMAPSGLNMSRGGELGRIEGIAA